MLNLCAVSYSELLRLFGCNGMDAAWSGKDYKAGTCSQICIHCLRCHTRLRAHSETFHYKMVWMSAAQSPMGIVWLQLRLPCRQLCGQILQVLVLQQNGRKERGKWI